MHRRQLRVRPHRLAEGQLRARWRHRGAWVERWQRNVAYGAGSVHFSVGVWLTHCSPSWGQHTHMLCGVACPCICRVCVTYSVPML